MNTRKSLSLWTIIVKHVIHPFSVHVVCKRLVYIVFCLVLQTNMEESQTTTTTTTIGPLLATTNTTTTTTITVIDETAGGDNATATVTDETAPVGDNTTATTEKTIDETAEFGDTATATPLTEMDEMEYAYRMEGEEEEGEACKNCGSVHSHIDTVCATAIENGLA